MLYRPLYALVLRRIPPETAHALAARGIALACRLGLLRVLGRPDPALAVDALGLRFPSPLGVAAGVDKDASWFEGLGALGFGSVEVGTVTPLAQEGNPRPRVSRLTADRALQNSMGFPNPGADAVAARLARRRGPTVVGVNVGRSKGATAEQAAGDYRATVLRLAPVADYLVLNVSSPNTPGLRDLQAVEPLRGIVAAVREALGELDLERPVLVKIAPDLADEDVDAIAELALELAARRHRRHQHDRQPHGAAQPRRPRPPAGCPARRCGRARSRCCDGCAPGPATASCSSPRAASSRPTTCGSACRPVRRSCRRYTGFVYGGPGLPRRVNRDLARRLRAASAPSWIRTSGLLLRRESLYPAELSGPAGRRIRRAVGHIDVTCTPAGAPNGAVSEVDLVGFRLQGE